MHDSDAWVAKSDVSGMHRKLLGLGRCVGQQDVANKVCLRFGPWVGEPMRR